MPPPLRPATWAADAHEAAARAVGRAEAIYRPAGDEQRALERLEQLDPLVAALARTDTSAMEARLAGAPPVFSG